MIHEAATCETIVREATTTLDPVSEAIDRLESGIGPHRILRTASGKATPPTDQLDWQVRCHCVLVREDGWTLGCTKDLYEAARELWAGQWLCVIAYANSNCRVVVTLAR